MKNIFFVFFILLTITISFVSTQCSDCNGHGECGSNGCVCEDNYAGDDCSIYFEEIEMNKNYSGSVSRQEWNYFKFVSVEAESFVIHMIHKSGSDADLYVRKAGFPSTDSSDYQDISLALHSKITIEPSANEQFYIGVFGFKPTNFTLFISYHSRQDECVDECNNQGDCRRGTCHCYQGFAGSSCQHSVESISTSGSEVTGYVARRSWKFYQVEILGGNFLSVDVVETGGPENDVDVFLRYDEIPSRAEFDSKNDMLSSNFSITVSEPALGTWYIGFYGFAESNYTAVFKWGDMGSGCASNCSLHGSCFGSFCECYDYFQGSECEEMTRPLQDQESVTGFVEYHSWNYYTFNADTANNLVLNVTHRSGEDCDLYVRFDSKPTLTEYDLFNMDTRVTFSLEINSPSIGTYHFGIYGYKSCLYTMDVFESSDCVAGCGDHGECVRGECVCDDGWAGDQCDMQDKEIVSGETQHAQISRGDWKYFTISATTSAIELVVKEKDSEGFVWSYISTEAPPTIDLNDVAETKTAGLHTLELKYDEISERTFYVGLYASPLSSADRDVEFDFVCWLPQI